MTQKRKLHHLIGTINYAWLGTSRSKIYPNQPFYWLGINQQKLFRTPKTELFAFANLVSSEIWKTLEEQTFKGKKYRFYCEKRTRGWRLKNWEEIKE